jgi:hypothetical protein
LDWYYSALDASTQSLLAVELVFGYSYKYSVWGVFALMMMLQNKHLQQENLEMTQIMTHSLSIWLVSILKNLLIQIEILQTGIEMMHNKLKEIYKDGEQIQLSRHQEV